MVSGAIIFSLGLPLAWVIYKIYLREEAATLGVRAVQALSKTTHDPSNDPQFTLREALRLRTFWFLSAAMALRHLVTEGVSVHFVVLLVDRGWSTAAASTLLGISALIGAPARLGMGWLGDLVDKRKMMMGLLLSLSLSVLLMGQAAEALIFTPCMIVYSLAYGGLASLQEPIRADYFGTKAFATIQGMSRSITTAGTFLGPIIAGVSYDLTRSYAVAFSIFSAVSLGAVALMFLARQPHLGFTQSSVAEAGTRDLRRNQTPRRII